MVFRTNLKCYTSVFGDKYLDGGKIILPPSSLHILMEEGLGYPMMFKLTNKEMDISTHCGVLEFIANEGSMYVPYWIMQQLQIQDGDNIFVENVFLKSAKYSKFQPQSKEFLELEDVKSTLEEKLRDFTCLTLNDVISIIHENKVYELRVLELSAPATCIVECDMNVDFAAPVDYIDPSNKDMYDRWEKNTKMKRYNSKTLFSGHGRTLSGKKDIKDNSYLQIQKGVPNYEFKRQKLTFSKVGVQDVIQQTTEIKDEYMGKGNVLVPD